MFQFDLSSFSADKMCNELISHAYYWDLPEAYHVEAFNFPYTFETMLLIIPDQWKSLFQFLPILGNSE